MNTSKNPPLRNEDGTWQYSYIPPVVTKKKFTGHRDLTRDDLTRVLNSLKGL